MATLLDVTALRHFEGLFPFLLVLVLIYAVLARSAFFKDKPGMAAVIALICAVMTLFSKVAMKTINLMAPWFVLLVIFMVLFILAFMLFGYDQKALTEFVSSGEWGVGIWVMSIMLIIGLGSLAVVINEEQGFKSLAEGNVSSNVPESEQFGFWQTLFHPKVLGMALILLVSFFTIRQLSKSD